MRKHTQGKWTTDGGNTVLSAESDQLNNGYAICETCGPDQNANATMIAAAPDLLDALEAAIECGMVPTSTAKDGGATRHARQVVVADMIRDAIAKAKGESQ